MSDLSKELDGLSGDSLGSSVTIAPKSATSPTDDLTTMANAPKAPRPSITDPGQPAGNSFWYDVIHPQTADLSHPQSWRDWATKTYYPTATDYGNAALDDVSMGSADYAQSKMSGGGIADIRARTAASQAALGPMGPIVNAATYVAGPGKVLGPLAAIGKGTKAVKAVRAGVEAAGAGATSSLGHDLGSDKPFDQRAWDAAAAGLETAPFGVAGNWLGRGTARTFQSGFDAAQGAPGRGGDKWFGPWREAAARGDDIRPEVQKYQDQYGVPMDPVLKAAGTGTGAGGDFVRGAGRTAGHVIAGHVSPIGWFIKQPGDVGEWAAQQAIDRVRNYSTQKALDKMYPTVAGAPLHADTSGWTRAIQQGITGGSLP